MGEENFTQPMGKDCLSIQSQQTSSHTVERKIGDYIQPDVQNNVKRALQILAL